MIMILFQSPARWNLHVFTALVGEWIVSEWVDKRALVKGAEQKEEAIKKCVCVYVWMKREAVCKVLI